jgi:hypothetical protein
MRKRILLTVLIIGLTTVSSLKAQFSLGPALVYATDINTLGISANANYGINEKFGAMGSYTYFFSKDHVDWWALDIDGTYTFTTLSDKSKLYALAGFNIIYWKYNYMGYTTPNDSHAGINIGAGLKYALGKKMDLVPEVRYTIESGGYLRAGVKLMFGL